mmetsp:Transcript_13714/g.33767  ORF Transcript_13714/g.33767 Transcript_13714/m.33767 type:complete len:155 (-) Transcript_13714:106-570(-)
MTRTKCSSSPINMALLCLLPLLMATVCGGHLRVCLVQNPGFAECTPGRDHSTFTGIDVELIRRVSRNISWTEVPDPGPGGMPLAASWSSNSSSAQEPITFSFVCGTQRVAATISILGNRSAGGDAECALGAGAFTVTQERLRTGVRFSWCVSDW